MIPTPRQKYSTDLTQKQWNEIKKIIPRPKRITKRTLDQREINNAVLYLVHTGCQWRNLPHAFPTGSPFTIFGISGETMELGNAFTIIGFAKFEKA